MATVLGGLAVTLAVVWYAGSANERYFAGTSLRSEQQRFLGDSLAAMDEPVLAAQGRSDDYRALRVLYLPFWGRPVALRYEGEGHAIRRRAIGLVGHGTGAHSFIDRSDTVSVAEFAKVLGVYEEAGLFTLPPTDDTRGFDGSWLVVEAVVQGRRHVVARWSPKIESRARRLEALVTACTRTLEQAGLRQLPC